MGLPFVQEIFDGIRWTIDFFFNKIPKPLAIAIFLIFILIFGNLLSWVLQIGGIHCNSDKEAIKIDTIDIVTNVKIFWWTQTGELTSPTVTVDEAQPWTKFVYLEDALDACTWTMRYNSIDTRWELCEDINASDCKFYYRGGDTCHDCDSFNAGWIYTPDTILNWKRTGDLCNGSAEYKEDLNYFTRNVLCEPLCEIPPNYEWDPDNGNFVCNNLDVCGVNATQEPQPKVDFELQSKGGQAMYTTNKDNIENFIRISCSDTYRPRLTFYTIDIFDYKIWVFLIILYVMIHGLIILRGMS